MDPNVLLERWLIPKRLYMRSKWIARTTTNYAIIAGAPANIDGVVQNFDVFSQNDIVVFSEPARKRTYIYPHRYFALSAVGSNGGRERRAHVWFFKFMAIRPAINTGNQIYMVLART